MVSKIKQYMSVPMWIVDQVITFQLNSTSITSVELKNNFILEGGVG